MSASQVVLGLVLGQSHNIEKFDGIRHRLVLD
jgi:hypothetical protein